MKKMLSAMMGVALLATSTSMAALMEDDASNYSGGWNNTDTYGTGFSTWSFSQSSGYWVADNTASPFDTFADIASSDNSVLAMNYGTAYVSASRTITSWGDGYSFGIDLATHWRTGARGFDLNNGGSPIFSFYISDFGYGDTGWAYQGDMKLAVTATQNGSNLDIQIVGSSASAEGGWTDTYTTSVAGTLDGFSLYTGENGTDDQTALLFNNMQVVPEPATMGLLAVFGGGLLLVRRCFMM